MIQNLDSLLGQSKHIEESYCNISRTAHILNWFQPV